YVCIILTNSIKRNSKPNFKKSSKEDSTKHGFGYKKIKTIVKKYDGNLDTEITKDKVIMTITLKLN
ncbi:MAG: GHKL domain-containing protein, partial [Coprobacillus sp.]